MPQVRFDNIKVSPGHLEHFCCQLLGAAGLSEEEARIVAESLVEANLRGIDSHGVARLPHYLRRIEHGSIKTQPKLHFEKLGDSVGRINGDQGLGQVVTDRATTEAIRLARNTGSGWVSVANSSHCGALAYYGLKIANAGMIGFVFTHVDPMVLPFGAKASFCGTNPICITAPRSLSGAGELATGALCLDMATSKVPWNTVANAAMEQVPIKPGWAVDEEGNETTDAQKVASLYPVGKYKGSGLGLLIDMLCSMLSNSPFGPNIPKMYGDPSEPRRLGGLVGAIDIERFVPLKSFHERVAEMIHAWCELPPSQSDGQVLYPGQPELLEKEYRLKNGVPIGLNLLDEFRQLALKYRLPKEALAHLENSHLQLGFHVRNTLASHKTIDNTLTPDSN